MTSMEEQSANNPFLVDSLNHPLAGPIRKLLTREGRRELNQIIIDDEENILQAIEAGVEIDSLYFAGEELNDKDLILQGLSKEDQKKVIVDLVPTADPKKEAGTRSGKFDITIVKIVP